MKFLYLLLILCLFPLESYAWEQTMTCDGAACGNMEPLPTHWEKPCIGFHLNEKGTSHIPLDKVEVVVKKSIQAWIQPEESSLYPYFSGMTNEDRVGFNPYIDQNANIIVFRDDDTWMESPAMMALTTVTHRNSTGLIYDADIEVNTTNYRYGIYEEDGVKVVDLQNTLTHEIGHVFGLSHSNVVNATMFPYASSGEINLRKLKGDDLDAIHTIYPPSNTQCKIKNSYFEKPPYGMTEAPAKSGCSQGNGRENLPIALILLLMMPLIRRRTT